MIDQVYIIDHAEAMRPEAANALLKTLEEPSADSLIILVKLIVVVNRLNAIFF